MQVSIGKSQGSIAEDLINFIPHQNSGNAYYFKGIEQYIFKNLDRMPISVHKAQFHSMTMIHVAVALIDEMPEDIRMDFELMLVEVISYITNINVGGVH